MSMRADGAADAALAAGACSAGAGVTASAAAAPSDCAVFTRFCKFSRPSGNTTTRAKKSCNSVLCTWMCGGCAGCRFTRTPCRRSCFQRSRSSAARAAAACGPWTAWAACVSPSRLWTCTSVTRPWPWSCSCGPLGRWANCTVPSKLARARTRRTFRCGAMYGSNACKGKALTWTRPLVINGSSCRSPS